jgi:hypothetical protein
LVVTGSAKSYFRSADSGFGVLFHFCESCGSTVYWEPERKPEVVAVAAGCFAEEGQIPPPRKIAYAERQYPWIHLDLCESKSAPPDNSLEKEGACSPK